MLSIFRRKKHRQPMPPWLQWAAIAFLGFAFFGSIHHKNAANAPNSISEAFYDAAENLKPQKMLSTENYKSVLSPPPIPLPLRPAPKTPSTPVKIEPVDKAPLQSIKDITQGNGTPAICGQEVKITYQEYSSDKKPGGDVRTASFRIGEGKIVPAIEDGIVGMKKGGKRTMVSSSKHYDVTLLDTSPSIPDPAAVPLRIATTSVSNGKPFLCGMPGEFQITLWSTSGKKLYATEPGHPIAFTPGKSEVFLGLEQGVIGIRRGETRTLVVPPAYQKTMDGNPPKVDFPLPKDQTVLVDVEAMP